MASISGYTRNYLDLVVEKHDALTLFRVAIVETRIDTEDVKVKKVIAQAFVSKDEVRTLCYAVKNCASISIHEGSVCITEDRSTNELVIVVSGTTMYIPNIYSRGEIAQIFAEALEDEGLRRMCVDEED